MQNKGIEVMKFRDIIKPLLLSISLGVIYLILFFENKLLIPMNINILTGCIIISYSFLLLNSLKKLSEYQRDILKLVGLYIRILNCIIITGVLGWGLLVFGVIAYVYINSLNPQIFNTLIIVINYFTIYLIFKIIKTLNIIKKGFLKDND